LTGVAVRQLMQQLQQIAGQIESAAKEHSKPS
jgi:hypothetical protein